MAEEELVFARCCFSAPVCAYKLRSWCNRWLSCAPDGELLFVSSPARASGFLLLPSPSGLGEPRYRIQLAPEPGSAKSWFLIAREGKFHCAQRNLESDEEEALFSIQLQEHGMVSLGSKGGYMTTNRSGSLWIGPTRPRKWEMLTLVEQLVEGYTEEAPWTVQAPVRVTLQTCNGKYLCASKPVVGARAEAPCCCEEFLIDLWFSSLPSQRPEETRPRTRSFLRALFGCAPEEEQAPEKNSFCTIRTADGASLLTAGTDGNVFTTPVTRAQGRETFSVQLHGESSSTPRVCIQQVTAERRYLSAEFGHLVNRKSHRRACDYLNLQLASGSRVLLRSIHGGFLGASTRSSRAFCSCGSGPGEKQGVEAIGAWNLRSHGDSYYTFTSASTVKRGADVYLFADASGRICQSSNPRVHFPAPASLFEVKPVSSSGITPKSSSKRIIGFTIRTVRKINGKQRYLSVEPNGSIRAIRLSPSRWELFQVIDVDAVSAAAAPHKFCCVPASFNRQPPPPSHGAVLSRVSLSMNRGAPMDSSKSSTVPKASEVAALAVIGGQAVPRKSSASLQELCITQVCTHASGTREETYGEERSSQCSSKGEDEFSELVAALCSLSRSHELLPVNIPPEFAENSFNIPDDLLTRIWSTCRSRQAPKDSCKWLPSAFVPQPQGPRHRFGPHAQRPAVVEGWHCSSCDQSNVLPMDAAVNPAHHRYLDVYSRAIQSTGVLWNLISLAGVSVMSTALFCQIKAVAGRRSSGSQNSFSR